MAHSKQAEKRHRQNLKARALNKSASTAMKSAIKRVLASKDPAQARGNLALAMKRIDMAAKHSVIHKNTAARYKARVSRAVARAANAPK